MGRRSHSRTLNAWINGQLVGQWIIPTRGPMEFRYEAAWVTSPEARPLSLSLPINLDGMPLKGEYVGFYFDNLLPDSSTIRKRLQSRFHTQSQDAFDLLEAIGRDCVGAVQLLPHDKTPDNIFSIRVIPLDEAGVEQSLLNATTTTAYPQYTEDDEDFRISIAGAQEKTALTLHEGQWCRPLGATPTTHIFKLPLGLVGARKADMHSSVENEWLCAELLRTYGVPMAECEIKQFGTQKALVVQRFDRRLVPDGKYWIRLPQEDFCQALGVPSSSKYEADGGPGLSDIAGILRTSESREADLSTLMRAQLLFWMLAATDGHAKNLSLYLLQGGRYRLTPLYDVLSAWPVVGKSHSQLDFHKLKLAMALHAKNAHYKLKEIQRRHFLAEALSCGFPRMDAAIEDVVSKTPDVISQVANRLPKNFPQFVFESVTNGLLQMSKSLSPPV